MASTIAFVAFDILGIAFLLWCLANFYRENRRYRGASVEIMRLDPLPSSRTASVVTMQLAAITKRQDRVATLRHAIANARAHRG